MNLRHLQQYQIARSCSKLWDRWVTGWWTEVFKNTDNYDHSSLLRPKIVTCYKEVGNQRRMPWNTGKKKVIYVPQNISTKISIYINISLWSYRERKIGYEECSIEISHRSPLPWEFSPNILVFNMVADLEFFSRALVCSHGSETQIREEKWTFNL